MRSNWLHFINFSLIYFYLNNNKWFKIIVDLDPIIEKREWSADPLIDYREGEGSADPLIDYREGEGSTYSLIDYLQGVL